MIEYDNFVIPIEIVEQRKKTDKHYVPPDGTTHQQLWSVFGEKN